jgi:hypothetical protein
VVTDVEEDAVVELVELAIIFLLLLLIYGLVVVLDDTLTVFPIINLQTI